MLQCNYRIQFIILIYIFFQLPGLKGQSLSQYQEEKFLIGTFWSKKIAANQPPEIIRSPKLGQFSIQTIAGQQYRLVYDNDGSQEYDTAILLIDDQILPLVLKPKFVVAQNEYVIGYTGLQKSISVLDNDQTYSNIGLKYLPFYEGLNVVSESATTARIANVRPGIQHFIYTACDGYDQCDEARVTVLGLKPDWQKETIALNLSVHEDYFLPLPESNLEWQTSKLEKGLKLTETGLAITGNALAAGLYTVTLTDGSRALKYELTLEDEWKRYSLNQPDRVYIHPGQSLAVNVNANDCVDNVQKVINVGNGLTVQQNSEGSLEVKASGQFLGKSSFQYISCFKGLCDTALVHVYVDPFKPALDQFQFEIDPSTAYILPFENPNPNFTLKILQQGKFGAAVVLPGNKIQYTPNGQFDSEDYIRIQYEVQTPTYQFESQHEIKFLASDLSFDADCDRCIWSGDTDYSNYVDFTDIQSIAKYMGASGNQRTGGSQWKPQQNQAWISQENKDIQFFDTDGDGVITIADIYPVLYHYGLHHGLFSAPIKDTTIPVRVTTSKSYLTAGDHLELDIVLGDENHELESVTGISLEVYYDQKLVDGEDIIIITDKETWLKSSDPTIEVVTHGLDNNVVAGQYRVKSKDIDGFGVGMKMNIIVEDEIEGFTTIRSKRKELNLSVKNIVVHTAFGNIFLPDQKVTVPFGQPETNAEFIKEWQIYPNPTNNVLTIAGDDIYKIEKLTIYDMKGIPISSIEVDYGSELPRMYLDRLSSGMYILEIVADGNIAHKNFTVIH